LRAVADDRERMAVELLREEHAEHRAVSAGRARARAVGIEVAQGDDGETVHAAPVQYELLAQILAERVGILGPDRRGLGRGIDVGDAVTRGRRRVDEALDAGCARALERAEGAHHVGADVRGGALDRRDDVAERREVEHPLGARELAAIRWPSVTSASTNLSRARPCGARGSPAVRC
jgi:hypothetical protein